MNRILVIRGGAIGDFIVTLPAIKALRETWPDSEIEILGYQHIAGLAESRYYASAVRSIEHGPLSSFFAKNSELPPALAAYFAGFDLIVSYLYDPDGIFEDNLRRSGAKRFLAGPARIGGVQPAPQQLARPLGKLGITVADFAPRIFPSEQDRQFARDFLTGLARPLVALHPGSGSEKKNWPVKSWLELGDCILGDRASRSGGFPVRRPPGDPCSLVVVSGEADETQVASLENKWKDRSVRFARNLPLTNLAALLEGSIFVGHDSGISHLAAGVGADCILLFGPTDHEVWGPLNEKVRIVRAPSGRMENLAVASVYETVAEVLRSRNPSHSDASDWAAIKR